MDVPAKPKFRGNAYNDAQKGKRAGISTSVESLFAYRGMSVVYGVLNSPPASSVRCVASFTTSAHHQGLTFVHFSAQLERTLWDRGALRGCVGGA